MENHREEQLAQLVLHLQVHRELIDPVPAYSTSEQRHGGAGGLGVEAIDYDKMKKCGAIGQVQQRHVLNAIATKICHSWLAEHFDGACKCDRKVLMKHFCVGFGVNATARLQVPAADNAADDADDSAA